MTSSIKTSFGSGGAGLTTPDAEGQKLATALRDAAADIEALNDGPVPAWLTAQVVTSHAWTAPSAGWVVAAEATTGSVTGAKQIQQSGSPATGFCTVTYTAGVPTVTFNAGTDAVTAASILFIPASRGITPALSAG